MITLNIPTSLSDIKALWHTHKSKRARNNKKVITDLKKDVFGVLKACDDIPPSFIIHMDERGDKHLNDCFNRAFKKIK